DNPADFNTMVRLKEFVQGGADSRQEVHAVLSLEELQVRHRRMMKTIEANRTAELDEVTAAGGLLAGAEQESLENSPPPAFDEASGEVTGQLVEATTPGDDGPRAAVEADPDDEPEPGKGGRHTGNVGPTRPGSVASWDDEDDGEDNE